MDKKNDNLKDLRSENPKLFSRLMQEHDAASRYDVYEKIDSDKAWQRFRDRHFSGKPAEGHREAKRRMSSLRIWKYPIAAAIACVIAVAATLTLDHSLRVEPTQMAQEQNSSGPCNGENTVAPSCKRSRGYQNTLPSAILPSAPMPEEFFESDAPVEVLSSTASERKLHLSDGTTVWLNNGAKLKYPASFEADNRTVYLEGEAYFEVRHQAGRPFYVRTDNGIVKEYGTSFNVNATSHSTTVTLVEGCVSVLAEGYTERVITPGEQVVVSQDGIIAGHRDITNDVAWKTGIYKMDNVSVGEFANYLEEWYGYNVVFQSEETREARFSGIVNRNKSLSTLLAAVAYATGIRIRIAENCIIFE